MVQWYINSFLGRPIGYRTEVYNLQEKTMRRGAQALLSLLPLFLALSSLSVVSAASGKQGQVLASLSTQFHLVFPFLAY